MIIVNELGNEIYLFNSIEEVESKLEAIDIENNEYEACDDDGFIYKFKNSKSLLNKKQISVILKKPQN